MKIEYEEFDKCDKAEQDYETVLMKLIKDKPISYEELDEELINFINKSDNNIQNVGENISKIANKPWISTKHNYSKEETLYHFSIFSKIFTHYFIKISDKENIIGFLFINNRDLNFKLNYSYFDKKAELNEIVNFLRSFLNENKAKSFLCFDNSLNKFLTDGAKFYFYKKEHIQFYTSSKDLDMFSKSEEFMAGYGDASYT